MCFRPVFALAREMLVSRHGKFHGRRRSVVEEDGGRWRTVYASKWFTRTAYSPTSKGEITMSEYCKYCGTSARDARTLLNGWCPKHPSGPSKGKHALYEGGERSEYVCVYCGTKNRSLSSLLNGWCPKHPDGPSRGKHVAYDGRENGPYECKYCGREFRDIASMVNGWCPKHPNGPSRGKHSPAR